MTVARERDIALAGLGVATAGWVNPFDGTVIYATVNLPGWTGTRIAEKLRPIVGIPVAVKNDGFAAAVSGRTALWYL